jgi:hypothetical protein
MPHLDNEDHELSVLNLINNPVVTNTNSVELFLALQLDSVDGPRLLFK